MSYIIKYLNKEKFQAIVLTLSNELLKDSEKKYFEDELHIKIESLKLSRLQGIFFAKNKIKKFIERHNIDLVHSQGLRADNLMSNINGIQKVATLRNYPYYDYPMTYGYFIGFCMAKLHLKYLRKIDKPVVVSKSISDILKNYNNYKIDFVRNGTDVERFQNLDKKSLRKKLNFEKNEKIFISMGHLNKRKDPLTIIKAFKKSNIKNAKLILLGHGDLYSECYKEIGDKNNILLLGRVDNVNEFLGVSDYFVSASLAEGLPNTVLEAMACGLPCILSNIPPHLEIYDINNNSSLVFNTKDTNTLSSLMKSIISDDYTIMSQASKDIILNHLNAKIMSSNYQYIYENLLEIQ